MSRSPGPWKWESCDNGDRLIDGDGSPVFDGGPEGWGLSIDDSRLIASAPTLLVERDELLAALKDAVELVGEAVDPNGRPDALVRRERWLRIIDRIRDVKP